MATRAASIWRAVIQPHSMAFNPKSPNASAEPRHAFPAMRPRCCLRYFTFFGINIGTTLVLPGPPRRNPPYVPSLTRGAGAAEALGPGEADPPLRSPGRPSRSPVPVFLVAAQARHEPLALVE